MPRKDVYGGPISAQAQQDIMSEGIENFELPKSVVMKIAKSALPDNVKLQKETVLSLVKGSTVFINYLAATAHDVAQSKQHKSISASDVLKALESIEFSDMVNKLQGELQVYRDLAKTDTKNKKSTSNGASTARRASAAGSSVSAPPKGKGKEKVIPGQPLPPPFTSTPLDLPAGRSADMPMDIDDEEASASAMGRAKRDDEDDEAELQDGDEIEDDEVIDSDEGQSDDELEDRVALEDSELLKDNKGVEERPLAVEDDD